MAWLLIIGISRRTHTDSNDRTLDIVIASAERLIFTAEHLPQKPQKPNIWWLELFLLAACELICCVAISAVTAGRRIIRTLRCPIPTAGDWLLRCDDEGCQDCLIDRSMTWLVYCMVFEVGFGGFYNLWRSVQFEMMGSPANCSCILICIYSIGVIQYMCDIYNMVRLYCVRRTPYSVLVRNA